MHIGFYSCKANLLTLLVWGFKIAEGAVAVGLILQESGHSNMELRLKGSEGNKIKIELFLNCSEYVQGQIDNRQ